EEDGTVYGGDLRNSNGDKIIPTAADRRAHHNALERKRRDHIKDSFTSLRDSVPSLQGEKASRAQILKKAAEYIQFMRKKNNNVQSDIDEIAKQNKMLEDQIRRMEKAKNGGGSVGSGGLSSLHLAGSSGGSSSSAAASSVGNGVGGGGGGGGSPLLYTEQIEVSTSYDTSEQDSNGSCSNSNGPMIIQQQPMQPMH
ncbi:PREDICTED: protein max-like, partial [Rhagoletis zephyria]|uniref:protein max-like n=1 Tax=Rhagoletis zephyria TaxID=28612 RepID=UPI0008114B30